MLTPFFSDIPQTSIDRRMYKSVEERSVKEKSSQDTYYDAEFHINDDGQDLTVWKRVASSDEVKNNDQTTKNKVEYVQKGEYRSLETTYSSAYVGLRLKSVLKEVSDNLDEWYKQGTENGLFNIYSIKKIIEENISYFESNSSTRVLMATLLMIFENNSWESIPSNQIKHLSESLRLLSDQNIEQLKVKLFIKNLYLTQIKVLKNEASKEKTS